MSRFTDEQKKELEEVLHRYHTWLEVSTLNPHPDNKLYVPSSVLKALGLQAYVVKFIEFCDGPVGEIKYVPKDMLIDNFIRFAGQLSEITYRSTVKQNAPV